MIFAKCLTEPEVIANLPKDYEHEICSCIDGSAKLIITDPQYPYEHWILPEWWLLDRHGELCFPLDYGRQIDAQTAHKIFKDFSAYRIFFGHWHDDLQAFEVCHHPTDADYLYGYPLNHNSGHNPSTERIRRSNEHQLVSISNNHLREFTFNAMKEFMDEYRTVCTAYQTYCSEIALYASTVRRLELLFDMNNLILDTKTSSTSIRVYRKDNSAVFRRYYYELDEIKRLIDENIPQKGDMIRD